MTYAPNLTDRESVTPNTAKRDQADSNPTAQNPVRPESLDSVEVRLPAWLLEETAYTPDTGREGFATRSLASLLGVLRNIRRVPDRGRTRANAGLWLLLCLTLILLASLSRNMLLTYIFLAALLVRLCLLPGRLLPKVVLPALTAGALSALILLPAVFLGHPTTLLSVTLKVILSAGLLNTLAVTTPWHRLTKGLRFLFVPDMVIFILDMTLIYIVLLGDICTDLLTAVRLRSVGRSREPQKTFGGILGVTFLKSSEMARETLEAMTCRGFDGTYRRGERFHFRKWDCLPLLVMAGAILLFIFLG